MLNRDLEKCRRSVDTLNSQGFYPERLVASMRQMVEQVREDWTGLKNKYGSLTDGSPDAIFEAVSRRNEDQVGVLVELQGL